MGITQTNEYEIGVNNDLGNLANNVDNNRIGEDLTWLELDGGVIKVSVGSFIESQGNLYVVDTAAETPTGTAGGGAYLFFDDSVPGFVWSTTPGTYDSARGGIYDASNRRQCRWITIQDSTWKQLYIDQGVAKYRIKSYQSAAFFDILYAARVAVAPLTSSRGTNTFAVARSASLETWSADLDADDTSPIGSSLVTPAGLLQSVVALDSNTVVGGTTSLQSYQFNGSTWSTFGSAYTLTLTNLYGYVAMSSTRIVGLYSTTGSGLRYQFYDFDGSTWAPVGSTQTVTALLIDVFHQGVKIASDKVAICRTATSGGAGKGAAYIFDYDPVTPSLTLSTETYIHGMLVDYGIAYIDDGYFAAPVSSSVGSDGIVFFHYDGQFVRSMGYVNVAQFYDSSTINVVQGVSFIGTDSFFVMAEDTTSDRAGVMRMGGSDILVQYSTAS